MAQAWAKCEVEAQESAQKNGRYHTSTWYCRLAFAVPWKCKDGTWSWRNSLDHRDYPELTALLSQLEQDLIEIPNTYGALAEELRAAVRKRGPKTSEEQKVRDSRASPSSASSASTVQALTLASLQQEPPHGPRSGRKRKATGSGSRKRSAKRPCLDDSGHGRVQPEDQGSFRCQCGKTYTIKESLQKHLGEMEALSKGWHQCPKCLRRFARGSKLRDHTCGRRGRLDGSKWDEASTLTWNDRTHGVEYKEGDDLFYCKCGKSYGNRKSLQKHVGGIRNLLEERHKCSKCLRCFAEKSELARHKCGNVEAGEDLTE